MTIPKLRPGFILLEHPADIGIEAHGATLADAFSHAAAGLASVLLDPASVRERERQEVHLSAPDAERLLVRWLSEVLYLFDGRHFAPARFEIAHASHRTLDAVVVGEPLDPERHRTRMDVKAVTYHQVKVAEREEGVVAVVFLDI